MANTAIPTRDLVAEPTDRLAKISIDDIAAVLPDDPRRDEILEEVRS